MLLFDIVAALKSKAQAEAQWKLYTQGAADRSVPLAAEISKLSPKEQRPILKMLEMACRLGPEGLPREMRHEIDEDEKIFEFVKGNFRIPWFYDEGKVVICSHIFRKKTQKTPQREVAIAVAVKREYFLAKERGEIEVLEVE